MATNTISVCRGRIYGETADSCRLASGPSSKSVPSSTLFLCPRRSVAAGGANSGRGGPGESRLFSRLGSRTRPKSVPSSTLPFATLRLQCTGICASYRAATRVNAHQHRVHPRLDNTLNLAVEKNPHRGGHQTYWRCLTQEGSPLNNSLMTWRIRVSCASDRTPVLIFTVKLFTSLVMLPA